MTGVVLQRGRCTYCAEAATPGGRIFHVAGCPFEVPGMETEVLGGRREGADVRRLLGGPTGPRVVTDDARIVERYNAGESIRAVAAAEHVSYGTARSRLIRAGVPLRGRGGGPR